MKWWLSGTAVALVVLCPPASYCQQLDLNGLAAGQGAVFLNSTNYDHLDATVVIFDGSVQGPVLMASQGDQPESESGGVFAGGNVVTLWSPGDGALGVPSSPPMALVYVVDEDAWNDGDADPYDNGALQAYLDISGLWQTSDETRKTNIARLEGGLDRVRALNGYSFQFLLSEAEIAKGQESPQRVGVLAQEVQAVLPEAVGTNGDGEMWVNYSQITPLLIEAIKEQQELIERLQERLEALESRRRF